IHIKTRITSSRACTCTERVQSVYLYGACTERVPVRSVYRACTCTERVQSVYLYGACTERVPVRSVYRACTCTERVQSVYLYGACTERVPVRSVYRACTCTERVQSVYLYGACTELNEGQVALRRKRTECFSEATPTLISFEFKTKSSPSTLTLLKTHITLPSPALSVCEPV
uniref:Uncharacterized protein n=1 Tax=Seriola dumerili TaxID=41447 RepID=A0A3B4TAT9_SERDU